MAAFTVAAGDVGVYTKVLTASTVDTVTFTATDVDMVEIFTDGTAPIFVAFGTATPAVNGSTSWMVRAVAGSVKLRPRTTGATVVKLISSGTPTYSVARANN